MRAPPLLLAAALLFWGQQTGLWPLALPIALLLEGWRLWGLRWDLSAAQFYRLSDLCTLLFVAMVVYLYATREAARAIMDVVRWLPLSYLPLLSAQLYSVQGRVDIGALFMSRRKPRDGPRSTVDLSYPYLLTCLLAAGAANARTPVFYLGIAGLSAWALWRARPARTPVRAWAASFLLAAAAGYGGQSGLHRLQVFLENTASDVLFSGGGSLEDPFWSRTAMGRPGRLKQSDEIVLRVEAAAGGPPPALLRQSSYDLYRASQWLARGSEFLPVAPQQAGWALGGAEGPLKATVSAYLPRGSGVLALPTGAVRVERLPAGALSRNRLGAVKIEDGPGLARYAVGFGAGSSSDAPPGAGDLELPQAEESVLRRLAGELKLDSRRPEEARAVLLRFFQERFRYSLTQEAASSRPLEDFLLVTRTGHCEFFASATVLLLRAARIPARYATGYAVQEESRLEGAFVVRQRHAHAWALVFSEGRWRDLDTTPSGWAAAEAAQAPFWRPAADLWSWTAFRFSRWRWREPGEARGGGRLLWLLPVLVLGLAWRWKDELKAKRAPSGAKAPQGERQGRDSELYAVERALEETGLGRRPGEPLGRWVDRVGETAGAGTAGSLRPLLALHNRYRFDPAGLTASQRRALRDGARAWLALRTRPAAS